MDLDPSFVQIANHQLWAAHPELGGRQLTGAPADAALRSEWRQYYSEAAAKTPPKPAALPSPIRMMPSHAPVLPCNGCHGPLRRWLCIRSNQSGWKGTRLIGHSNLSLHEGATPRSGKVTTYALWPDFHDEIEAQGRSAVANDIETNWEMDDPSGYKYAHCREITPEQYKRLQFIIAQGREWRYTHHCASWARDTFLDVTGIRLNADDWVFGIESPRAIGNSILDLNDGKPSNFDDPDIPLSHRVPCGNHHQGNGG